MDYPNLICKNIITQEDTNGDTTIVHCTHPKNPCDSEGNCNKSSCPEDDSNRINPSAFQVLPVNICNSIDEAPNYNKLPLKDQPTTLKIDKAVIVKKATIDGDASIDLQLSDGFGNTYMTMTSAKLLKTVVIASGTEL